MSQATLHTNHGPFVVVLFVDVAPKTGEYRLRLGRVGLYYGVIILRVA